MATECSQNGVSVLRCGPRRRHAHLLVLPGTARDPTTGLASNRFELHGLPGAQPTAINGAHLNSSSGQQLRSGDRIRIGEVTLLFVAWAGRAGTAGWLAELESEGVWAAAAGPQTLAANPAPRSDGATAA